LAPNNNSRSIDPGQINGRTCAYRTACDAHCYRNIVPALASTAQQEQSASRNEIGIDFVCSNSDFLIPQKFSMSKKEIK